MLNKHSQSAATPRFQRPNEKPQWIYNMDSSDSPVYTPCLHTRINVPPLARRSRCFFISKQTSAGPSACSADLEDVLITSCDIVETVRRFQRETAVNSGGKNKDGQLQYLEQTQSL